MDYISHYAIIIILFYVHADLVVPYVLQRKYAATWKLVFAIALELAFYVLVCFADDKILYRFHLIVITRPLNLNFIYIVNNLYRGVYFTAFSTGYYFLRTYYKEKQKNAEIEKQRLNEIILRQKAEQELTIAHHAFLKAQINPHFLFNSLDFIHYQVMEVSPKASDVIIALSEMMRFAIDADKGGEFIYLGEEIDQVINLQYLNQVRKNDDASFQFTYEESVRNLTLIPLMLLTISENIFKHGNLSNQNHAFLSIRIIDNFLVIESDNLSRGSKNTRESSGTGLANIEKRLGYAYGNNATLAYHLDDGGYFKLKITVPIRLLHAKEVTSATSEDIDTI